MTAHTLRRHARRLLGQELQRRRGALARLPDERRAEVEQLVARAVTAMVDGVLQHARDDPLVAAALESVYGDRSALSRPPAVTD